MTGAGVGITGGACGVNTPRKGAQPATLPTMATHTNHRAWRVANDLNVKTALGKRHRMALLLLEALGALLIFIFIVWWTMFSGRKNGEPIDHNTTEDAAKQDAENPPKD